MKPTCNNCFREFEAVSDLLTHQFTNECYGGWMAGHENDVINELSLVPVVAYHFQPSCCE
jgi:hypothetical protein